MKKSGYLRFRTPSKSRFLSNSFELQFQTIAKSINHDGFSIPERNQLVNLPGFNEKACLKEANQILKGKLKLFTGLDVKLDFSTYQYKDHWTRITDSDENMDIKFIWEPARFSWAFTLARAYQLNPDEKYPACFWKHFEAFQKQNPINLGPNWHSGQEIALRIIAFGFALQVFGNAASSTTERKSALLKSIAVHAERIPTTLIYARAQNNNHLFSEAVGLYYAGVLLSTLPISEKWRKQGLQWFNQAVKDQIYNDGTQIQHSINYHRMVMHCACLMKNLCDHQNYKLAPDTERLLSEAAKWMITLIDRQSGHAPNLGSNDGALLFPLSQTSFQDYRPAGQLSAMFFLNCKVFESGPWDESLYWFRKSDSIKELPLQEPEQSTGLYKLGNRESWAMMNVPQFKERPAHADILHTDIWWEGENIAMDPGTFRYTAPYPWNNRLGKTLFHNTVSLNNKDQMKHVSRFLWLEIPEIKLISQSQKHIAAEHTGYLKDGWLHRRTIQSTHPYEWVIKDELISKRKQSLPINIQLHWLLPDWEYSITHDSVIIKQPRKEVVYHFQNHNAQTESLGIIRAGKPLSEENPEPLFGWVSPSYAVKKPALSVIYSVKTEKSCELITIINCKKQIA